MPRRHREDGDDPDEYWAVCEDCDGTRIVSFPASDDFGNLLEGLSESGQCPNCDGLGFVSADEDDFE